MEAIIKLTCTSHTVKIRSNEPISAIKTRSSANADVSRDALSVKILSTVEASCTTNTQEIAVKELEGCTTVTYNSVWTGGSLHAKTSSIRPVFSIQDWLVRDGRTDRGTHDDSIYRASKLNTMNDIEYTMKTQSPSVVKKAHKCGTTIRHSVWLGHTSAISQCR